MNNMIFSQKNNLNFTEINNSKIGSPSFSTGAAYSDFDNDGDLDVVTNNINKNAFIYKNNASKESNFLRVVLTDSKNKSLKGSKVKLYCKEKVFFREYQTTRGFMSSSTHKLSFGLGDIKQIDSLVILWSDQSKQVINTLEVNKEIKIQKQTSIQNMAFNNDIKSGYIVSNLPYKMQENIFYDENSEKLIPERLSYDGQALVAEDLDGDNILDLFLGGSRNYRARLLIGNGKGSFVEKETQAFKLDDKFEDTDAATIDFDGDGDRDLYVVSGGSDAKEMDKILEDRIYLNNGKGVFKRIPISLPHTNGSCIAVADVDGDGFEDIFVGARSIPGSYGLSPYSFLLKNRKGQGLEIIKKERYGMIKDAQFVDIDGDKDKDLVMCGDWMPITVLKNNGGSFSEVNSGIGLEKDLGFWNTIEFVDINKDGKLDILAGNSGLNHKWQASHEKPIRLYVGDFDKNGSADPIIFYSYFSKYIPFQSMDKLFSHMPILKKKFTQYAQFKQVSDISHLFAEYKNDLVELKSVTELRSMSYINENGVYKGYPLNPEEQRADINDFEIGDDGSIFYVGNNHNYVAELGKSTSNAGRILGTFETKSNKFNISIQLPIKHGSHVSRIAKIGANKFIAIANEDYSFIIQKQ
jgi:hypothetical protein